jgi:lipopolysaccharide transport system ATP-binding protein
MEKIIQVSNLSKSYIISHEGKERYTALRDVIAQKARKLFSFPSSLRVVKQSAAFKEEFWALKDVNFEIEQGDRVGIIGRNGAGKSTLLKILSRITEPTTGQIKIKGRVASLLEVGTGFHPELTGRENIFLNGAILGMSRAEIKRKFDEIVDFAEVEKFLDTPVKRYSSGMYVRLAFAVAAHLEPEILVVDEVLAVGDAQFQKKCLGKMEDVSKNEGRTVLFVSHQLNSIIQLCTKGILLDKGRLKSIGDANSIVQEYISSSEVKSKIKTANYLKLIEAYQEDDYIIIKAAFDSNIVLDIPNLGFVIYNAYKVPIFGSNPIIDISDVKTGKYTKGEILVKIVEPKLIDGLYYISIWFGDSKEDYVILNDCLTIEIVGMHNKPFWYPGNISGPIVPKVEWSVTG